MKVSRKMILTWMKEDLKRFVFSMLHRKDSRRCDWWYDRRQQALLKKKGKVWFVIKDLSALHTVVRFMPKFRERYPGTGFVLAFAKKHMAYRDSVETYLTQNDVVIPFPLQSSFFLKRLLAKTQPKMIIFIEFIPLRLFSFLRLVNDFSIPAILIDVKISNRLYGKLKSDISIRRWLAIIREALILLCVGSPLDKKRLESVGFDPGHICVTESLKYDVSFPIEKDKQKAKETLEAVGIGKGRLVLLGGSTGLGEEALLLDMYQALKREFETLVLVLVPRWKELIEQAVEEIQLRNLEFALRSKIGIKPVKGMRCPDVLLVDVEGELQGLYAWATVVFLGQTMRNSGGSNIMEPASVAKPIVLGNRMVNYAEVLNQFKEANAVIQVQDDEGLRLALRDLFLNSDKRTLYGERAFQVVQQHAGSMEKVLNALGHI